LRKWWGGSGRDLHGPSKVEELKSEKNNKACLMGGGLLGDSGELGGGIELPEREKGQNRGSAIGEKGNEKNFG